MPNASVEEIMGKIAADDISAITLDTCIYEQYHFGFEFGLLKRVSQFAKSDITHLMVDVIWHEVSAHLRKAAADNAASVRKALKSLGNSWGIDRESTDAILQQLFNDVSSEAVTNNRLNDYMSATGGTLLECAALVELPALTSRYFATSAPFEAKEGKKNEFPDALSLLALEEWARRHGTKVLAVSNDGGWSRFCAESDHLYCINNLSDALSAFHASDSYARALIVKAIENKDVPNIDDVILHYVRHSDAVTANCTAFSDFYFEEQSVEIHIARSTEKISSCLGAIDVVDHDGSLIYLNVNLPFAVELVFYLSFQHWDGIDKEYIPFGSASISREIESVFELVLRFNIESGRPLLEHVDVSALSLAVDLGEVGPDWLEASPDE